MAPPAKTSLGQIVAAANRLLEAGGPEAVSMQAVADAVGVRPPSLYKHFRDRADLLAAVERQGIDRLGAEVAAAVAAGEGMAGVAHACRRFAHANPRLYVLMMSSVVPPDEGGRASRARAVAPLLGLLSEQVGEAQALEMARVFTAFVHGFISMEIAGAFQLGGDPGPAFDRGVALLLAGLSVRADR